MYLESKKNGPVLSRSLDQVQFLISFLIVIHLLVKENIAVHLPAANSLTGTLTHISSGDKH